MTITATGFSDLMPELKATPKEKIDKFAKKNNNDFSNLIPESREIQKEEVGNVAKASNGYSHLNLEEGKDGGQTLIATDYYDNRNNEKGKTVAKIEFKREDVLNSPFERTITISQDDASLKKNTNSFPNDLNDLNPKKKISHIFKFEDLNKNGEIEEGEYKLVGTDSNGDGDFELTGQEAEANAWIKQTRNWKDHLAYLIQERQEICDKNPTPENKKLLDTVKNQYAKAESDLKICSTIEDWIEKKNTLTVASAEEDIKNSTKKSSGDSETISFNQGEFANDPVGAAQSLDASAVAKGLDSNGVSWIVQTCAAAAREGILAIDQAYELAKACFDNAIGKHMYSIEAFNKYFIFKGWQENGGGVSLAKNNYDETLTNALALNTPNGKYTGNGWKPSIDKAVENVLNT